MNSQEYLRIIKSRFGNNAIIKLDTQDMLIAYEEIFKWKWAATKLKITSFVKYIPSIILNDIESYSENCLKQAIRDKKGFPIGFQNGVVSYNVIASEVISPDAIMFVTNRPKKYYSAFEMPVLFDLSRNGLYFYQGEIIWGKLYESFLEEYIVRHFYIT